jgi:hypothetical protein
VAVVLPPMIFISPRVLTSATPVCFWESMHPILWTRRGVGSAVPYLEVATRYVRGPPIGGGEHPVTTHIVGGRGTFEIALEITSDRLRPPVSLKPIGVL